MLVVTTMTVSPENPLKPPIGLQIETRLNNHYHHPHRHHLFALLKYKEQDMNERI